MQCKRNLQTGGSLPKSAGSRFSILEPMYQLKVQGRPVPKGRPRVTRTKKGKSHTYTPPKTKKQENKILGRWLQQFGYKKLEGDLCVECLFYYNDRRTADVDNLAKLVMDALGGGDEEKPFNDRQVKSLYADIFTNSGHEEQTEIIISCSNEREVSDE